MPHLSELLRDAYNRGERLSRYGNLVLDLGRRARRGVASEGEVMRVAMGDLTYIQPLGLPSFASGFPGIPFYSGGLKNRGMGRLGVATCPSVQQMQGVVDANDPCQASSAALNTPTLIDPSTNQPVSAEDQAAYSAAYNTGLLRIAYQQGIAAAQPTSTGLSGTMIAFVVAGTLALLLAIRR